MFASTVLFHRCSTCFAFRLTILVAVRENRRCSGKSRGMALHRVCRVLMLQIFSSRSRICQASLITSCTLARVLPLCRKFFVLNCVGRINPYLCVGNLVCKGKIRSTKGWTAKTVPFANKSLIRSIDHDKNHHERSSRKVTYWWTMNEMKLLRCFYLQGLCRHSWLFRWILIASLSFPFLWKYRAQTTSCDYSGLVNIQIAGGRAAFGESKYEINRQAWTKRRLGRTNMQIWFIIY